MTVPFQGFEKVKNLAENTLDRDALNNLGGTPIGEDLTRLKNNTRNTSVINVTSGNINVATSTIFFNNRSTVFSNRTKLTINGGTYYVKNTNSINSFQLARNADLSDTVAGANIPIGNYVRSDEITKENFINYSPRRRVPIEASQSSSEINQSGTAPITNSVKNEIKEYELNLDSFLFLRENAMKKTSSFLGNRTLEGDTFCLIQDPNNVNSTQLSTSGPGIFIYNPTSGTGVRAFSSNENVWAKNVSNTYLETTATKITVGNLYLSNNIVIEGKGGSAVTVTVPLTDITLGVSGSAFTHKTPITINGDTYFLCLTAS